MRDHAECQAEYEAALARGREGYAEYVLARCDLTHGHLQREPEAPEEDPA